MAKGKEKKRDFCRVKILNNEPAFQTLSIIYFTRLANKFADLKLILLNCHLKNSVIF